MEKFAAVSIRDPNDGNRMQKNIPQFCFFSSCDADVRLEAAGSIHLLLTPCHTHIMVLARAFVPVLEIQEQLP